MIKIENVEVVGWEHAIRGMRNPMNSWKKSDSALAMSYDINGYLTPDNGYLIGPNDLKLMMKLRNAGTDHRKFMRMIVVYTDITAPLYWWKEFDTYKVGTVVNSCSTMHKIADRGFTLEDFSCEHLMSTTTHTVAIDVDGNPCFYSPVDSLKQTIQMLNYFRLCYLEMVQQKVPHAAEKAKEYWWQLIQLLPSSYNQRRTVMMNYEVLANIYKSRKNHKLDEWREHKTKLPSELVKTCNDTLIDIGEGGNMMFGFCDWIKTLPYSELITDSSKPQL